MQRYNIFNHIHKGLRAMLYDTALTLQHTCFRNSDEAQKAIDKVKLIMQIFKAHSKHEDQFIMPLLLRYNQAASIAFEDEHLADKSLVLSLRNLMEAYNLAAGEEAKIAAGYAITMSFNEYIAFNLYHMNKEETQVNQLLWQYYSDKDLRAIMRRIIISIPPENMCVESKWMIRGISNNEIISWMCGIKNEVPDIIFKSLLNLAEAELPEHRWNAVKEGLMEGCLIA